MKTNSKLLVVILMTVFTVFFGKNAVAQFSSTYQIHNISGCSASGTWQIYSRQSGVCNTCGSAGNNGTFSLAPGAMVSIPIPAGCQPTMCDMVVTLNNVGGMALATSVTVSQSTSGQPVFPSALLTCSPLPQQLTWSPLNASVNP